MTCRIAIIPAGSHGDHQPYIPLMRELEKLGCKVQMWVMFESYEQFVKGFGLDANLIPGVADVPPIEQMLETNEEIRTAMATGKGLEFLKAVGTIMAPWWPQVQTGVLQKMEEFQPHLVLYSPLLLALARIIIDKFDIPVCMSYFYPRCPSKEYFPLNFAMPEVSLPFGLNESAHWFANKIANKLALEPEAQEERKRLGLKPITMHDLWALYTKEELPQIAGWSSHVSPPCSDWKNVAVTGWWTVPEDAQLQEFAPSEELNEFIKKWGSSCVYMGWGSMVGGTAAEMAIFATEAAMAADVPAIVLGGWAKIEAAALPDGKLKDYAREKMLFYSGKLPHEWLFQRCSCAVIHGGGGTTGAVLRSGIPCIITPIISDQFYWATCINKLNVGKGFSQHMSKVPSKDLGAAIVECRSNETIRQNAKDLGSKLKQEESGAAKAAGVIVKVARDSENRTWGNPFKDGAIAPSTFCW